MIFQMIIIPEWKMEPIYDIYRLKEQKYFNGRGLICNNNIINASVGFGKTLSD